MNRKLIFLISLFFVTPLLNAQSAKVIKGKILINDATPLGVIVLNLVSEKETVADTDGSFSIEAKVDDLLVFYATNLDKQRKIIEQKDFDSGYFEIAMTSKVEQLEEVEIVQKRFDAVSLGILSKPAKRYTPAQRRLYSSQSNTIDSFINFLSGRRNILHDAVAIEKKELTLAKLDGLYDEAFYTQTLKIEKEYIRGFHYFIVENQKFTQALNGKNQFLTNLLMIDLAREYNSIRQYDKE